MSSSRYANGHRRRELRARVLAEENECALCGKPVDKTLHHHNDGAAEVDEDIPVSRGGSPLERGNVRLMHRGCNRWKSARTLAEALAAMQATKTATITHLIDW